MSLPQPPAPPVTMECYRHPGRPAYRRCRRCGKPTGEECLVSTDLGAMCVECARQGRPDARTRARYWSARQPTLVTYILIGINVAIFTLVALDDPSTLTGGGALRPAPGLQQYDLGLSQAALALKPERESREDDAERAGLARQPGDDGRGAGAGAAAEAHTQKDHAPSC